MKGTKKQGTSCICIDHIIVEYNDSDVDSIFKNPELVGRKTLGLSFLPKKWRPPFAVIATQAYAIWKESSDAERTGFVDKLGNKVAELGRAWEGDYQRGIILRSSAVSESLRERGMLNSRPLPADFDADRISDAIRSIFHDASEKLGSERVAVIIQPFVPGRSGHLSNERRVSKTRNQWVWEQEGESGHFSGFNSQRAMPPDVGDELRVQDNSSLIKLFRSIGRWCTNLDKGRVHIEWSWSENRLWLLQLDFEDESPDDGIDPRTLIRGADGFPSEACRADGPLNEADLTSSATGWAKLDKVRQLTGVRNDPYPRLFWVQGSSIRSATFNLSELETEIRRVTNGRAVCRTDCNSDAIEKLNLPRTNSVSAKEAKDFIFDTLTKIEKKGAKPESVCFIIHKFIPAQSAAWSLASPNSQIVRVDSLWGVPDGLQYLPHDSFEYDVKRNKISSERLRYKPAYIQEIEDGSWREVKIARRLGRFRSLREQDIAEVATLTKAIADAEEKSVQVMWFCGIPDSVGIGRNLPWFLMDGAEYKTPSSDRIGPQRPRVRIRTTDDIGKALIDPRENLILVLEPEVELIRKDDEFLRRIIELARAKKISIELHGSRLGHAYYYLERSGLTVVPSDQPRYTRTRGRRVFGKLVRDSIPSKIQQHGEQVRLARIGRGEARAALLVKLMEEIHELKVAESPDDVKAELADVHEVIRSLCAATGVDWIDVEGIAEKKREQRGSFRENVVLLETSWPAGSTAEESEPRQILLRALAQTKVDGNSARMSYATLFAHGADSTLELASGTRIKIELDEVGVRILELKRGEASAMQLQLPLDKKNDE